MRESLEWDWKLAKAWLPRELRSKRANAACPLVGDGAVDHAASGRPAKARVTYRPGERVYYIAG